MGETYTALRGVIAAEPHSGCGTWSQGLPLSSFQVLLSLSHPVLPRHCLPHHQSRSLVTHLATMPLSVATLDAVSLPEVHVAGLADALDTQDMLDTVPTVTDTQADTPWHAGPCRRVTQRTEH